MRPTKAALRSLVVCALTVSCLAAFGQKSPIPLKLTPEDTARLDRGEAVIRPVGDARKLSLAAEGEFADALRSRVASLRPNYLSEVMLSIPRREGAIEGLASALGDVKGYIGIQYYSKRQEKYYDLFDKMDITSRRSEPGGETIETSQHMEPFAEYGCTYRYRVKPSLAERGSELFFHCENTSAISFDGVRAVSPGNMVWILYAFPAGDRIVFYGVGGVRAFDMLGLLRDRLEVSFLGRVEAFFGHMSKKLQG